MIHAVFALGFQLVIGLLTGNWWAGAAFGAAFYLGREHAQAEYRWIEAFGGRLRANLPWWGPFDLRVWRRAHSWVDWIAPLVVVSAVGALA